MLGQVRSGKVTANSNRIRGAQASDASLLKDLETTTRHPEKRKRQDGDYTAER